MFILESLKDTFFKLSFPIEKQKSTPTASGNYGHHSLTIYNLVQESRTLAHLPAFEDS